MKINERLLREQLSSQMNLSNTSVKGAEEYADDLCRMLYEMAHASLASHHIEVSDSFKHDDGTFGDNNMSVTYKISYNSGDVFRESMSTVKDYPPANMLVLFDIGWNMPKSKQIKEWDGEAYRPKMSRIYYDGEQFIKEACERFNSSTPSGVEAKPEIY